MACNGEKKITQKAGQGESNVKKNREREKERESEKRIEREWRNLQAKKWSERKQSK